MNNQNVNIFLDSLVNSLEHHGVNGQQWGKRRGPPYPLGTDEKEKNRELAKKKKKEESELKQKEKIQRKKHKYAKDITKFEKHIDLYSNDEVINIMKDFELKDRVGQYRNKHKSRKVIEIVNSMSNSAITISKFLAAGIGVYNSIAIINNFLGGNMRFMKRN